MSLFAESHDEDVASHCRAPRILHLLKMWENHATDEPPFMADMVEAGLELLADHYAVLMPQGEERFVYLHFGRRIAERLGRGRAGRTTDDLPPMLGRVLTKEYARALRTGRPLLIVNASEVGSSVCTWERLAVPLRIEGEIRLLIVLAETRELHESVSDAIIEASPDGILALHAIEDDLGTIYDARIVSANQSACRIIRRDRDHLLQALVLETFPRMKDDGIWDQCLDVFKARCATRFDINHGPTGDSGEFRFTLFPMHGGLAVMFQDITDLSGDAIPLIGRRASNVRYFGADLSGREKAPGVSRALAL